MHTQYIRAFPAFFGYTQALKSFSKLVVATCFLFILSSCTPYQKPIVIVPKQWPHAPTQQKKENPIALQKMQWWRQYHQQELNALIQKAVRQNNDLNRAVAHVEYAQSQLDQVKLNWLPGASLMAGISQFPILGNPGGFALAAPLYVINIFQQYKQQQSSQQLLLSSQYAKDCVTLMIISQVATSYFTLIAQQEAVILYEQLLQDERAYLKLSQTQYRFGLISEDDVMTIESELAQIQAMLDLVRHNVIASQNTLHYLLNENPGTIDIKASFRTLNSNAIIPDNVPVNVLNNRPDIRQNEALLRSAHANIGSSIANLLPSITLGAYLGTGTTSHGPINVVEAYPSLPINLPMYAQIKSSKAQFKEAYFKYVDTIKLALRDVDSDLSAYTAHTNQLNHLKTALSHATQQCHWVNQRFNHGLEDEVDVKRCHAKLDRLKLMINQSKLKKMLVIVKLYQDLAGGYYDL